MPKPCLCSYVPEILDRLEALEKRNECCCCEDEDAVEVNCCGDLEAREKELDEFEASLVEAEKANAEKLHDLERVSNQINDLKQQMGELQKDGQMSPEQHEQYEVNQKALQTYSQTWMLTNQMFNKMYKQLTPVFQLPEIPESNTSMFEGIQKLGAGLLAMAQVMEQLKQKKTVETKPTPESPKK